ncbi:MAG: hypothetical protein H0X30_38770 [Anaerolineae bacterium]|nr:hypothetical protein [Anaerolineae bacterium]
MKRKYRILLLAAVTVIALVISSLVVRQVGMLPHEDPLFPTPFPTPQITPSITVTIRPEIAILSQVIGGFLQETASASEVAKITPIGTLSPTLCPPSDVVCPSGNATLNPQQQVFQLMASAEGTEYAQLALTARALATSPTPTEHVTAASITATPTSSYQQPSCAFSWAHQAVPEAAVALQNAFNDAGVKSIEVVQVDAFGENCVNSNGKVVSFGAMGSDFYLTATVNNLNASNELAQIVATAYKSIKTLTVNLPGGPGYVDIMMNANGTSKHFRAMFSTIDSLIKDGKGDAELLAMGGL